MHASALRLSLVVGLASALCACGGGGGGSSSGGGGTLTPPVSNASPGGIWQGIDPISRLPVYALAAEDGRFQLIVDDPAPVTQYWGTLVTSGNSLSSSNIQLAKGPTYLGTATITGGSLITRQSMTAPVSFTPAPGCAVAVCGGPQSGTLTLTFNPVYNQGGALSRIRGGNRKTWRNETATRCKGFLRGPVTPQGSCNDFLLRSNRDVAYLKIERLTQRFSIASRNTAQIFKSLRQFRL